MEIKRIFLLFKSHFDIGFTMLAEDIVKYYAGDMLDRVFDTCAATKDMGPLRYVWTMPAWPLGRIREMVSGRRREKLDGLIRDGQISWHALPFTSHYDACGVEDAVRSLQAARDLSEEFRMPLHTAGKLTDVPGQGRLLPEILAGAGIEFLHIGVNDFAPPPDVPPIFRWQAPSGRSVVTMLNSGYGTGVIPPADWPFSTWIAILSTVDNSGPQSADIVRDMVKRIRARYPGAEIRCASLETAWQALRREDLSVLPVVRQDLADTWIHGIASYPAETALMRRVRGRLNRAEIALLRAGGDLRSAADRQIREAYGSIAMYTEHTWGLDVKTWLGKIPDYDGFDAFRASSAKCTLMEKSWNEQRSRALEAEKACSEAERLLGIADAEAPAPEDWTPLRGEQVLENAAWQVAFSADSALVRRVTDKRAGREVLTEKDGRGAVIYRHEVYGAEEMTEYLRSYAFRFYNWGIDDNGRIEYPPFCPHRTDTPRPIACEKSGDRVRFVFEGNPAGGDAEHVVLCLDLSGDRFRVRIDLSGKKATPYVESGELCFLFASPKPLFHINRPGSVLRPETDIAPRANHAFYALEYFAAIEDRGRVYAVVSPDAPLVSIGENGVYRYRRDYEPHAAEYRFNLFNNMWGTNFPQWIEGSFGFGFEVIAGKDVDEIYRRAADIADGKQEDLIPLPEGLRIAGVSAHGDELAVRVRNLTSRGIPFSPPDGMTETDLLGRDVPPEKVIAPYGIRAFRTGGVKMR